MEWGGVSPGPSLPAGLCSGQRPPLIAWPVMQAAAGRGLGQLGWGGLGWWWGGCGV